MNAALETVRRLIAVAAGDTVYRDLYLARAGELLAPVMSRAQYEEGRRDERAFAGAVAMSRAAALRLDWLRAAEEAQRAGSLRATVAARAAALAVAEQIYAAPPTAIDPFSVDLPGRAQGEPSALRAQLIANLAALATADREHGPFYEARRARLDRLVVASGEPDGGAVAPLDTIETAEVEQRALAAAERGDIGALARYARELTSRQGHGGGAAIAPGAAAPTAPRAAGCPVDLAAALPDRAVERAAALGLEAVLAPPLAQSQPLLDFVAAHLAHASPADPDPDLQREGARRIEAMRVALGWPPDTTAAVMALLGQFLHQVFVNSGGARYVPPVAAESVLVEGFTEGAEPATRAPLLAALGLPRRGGLSRLEIEAALGAHGAPILRDRLGLDPVEFRLVCVPMDLYTRIGRLRDWGQQAQWTHFDGYQVLNGGRLRALVGGDVRYGGLNDLVSIAASDQRAGVTARFAVVRRARQVARWR